MLKRQMVAAAVAATGMLFSAGAFAQAYVGGTVGRSIVNTTGCSASQGCKGEANMAKLLAGYSFNENFGLEASYADLGKVSAGNVTAKGKAIDLAAIARAEVASGVSAFLKGGLSYTKTNGILGDNATEAVYGIGATYSLTKQVALRAEWETRKVQYKLTQNGWQETQRNLSVGVQYTF